MRAFLICLSFFCPAFIFAQQMLESPEWCSARKTAFMPPNTPDTRSDSIDIQHTRIELDVSNPPQITGTCYLHFQTKVDEIPGIRLDLEGLTVDLVLLGNIPVAFNQSGAALNISFPTPLAAGTSDSLKIVYHGTPVTDGSGWGGVYNQSGYFYNLGVGFAADPHSFGRAWFPCFDNFVERCTFEFEITSQPAKPAYCNGAFLGQTTLPNGLVKWSWEIQQAIPSYLACFATGPYTSFKRWYPGENGTIPVVIAAAAADTNKIAGTFQHLPQAITAFEHWYGPYRWNKIGYSLVPFNSGAMEHATNIAIMRSAIDGTLGNETLWAHEFSHHWWGDLATCTTAEDMWLNEGWAVFSEHLFTEWVYGKAAYLSAVQTNFLYVLQNTHVAEGGYRAVSGLPHDLTYGDHVYKKGAVVAHNLRGYLGDSLFRLGLRTVLEETQFDDWSSAEFRDKLSDATGKDMTNFFDDWVFAPGFTHFSVDSVSVQPIGNQYTVTVFVKQKRRGAPHFYQQVPLEFTFVDAGWQHSTQSAVVSGEQSTVSFTLPFSPVFTWVNTNLQLTLARADKERVIKTAGQYSFSPAKLDMKVNAVSDSALVRVECHFAMPDSAGTANPNGYTLTNRYWSIEGDFPAGFDASANLFYDGRGSLDQLDTELFDQTGPSEDSIRLLYRPGPGFPWMECSDYFKNPLSSMSDRFGFVRIEHVIPGEYTFAKGISLVATTEAQRRIFSATTSPNPARQQIRVKAETAFGRACLFNTEGEQVREWSFEAKESAELSVSGIPDGSYWLVLWGKQGSAACSIIIMK